MFTDPIPYILAIISRMREQWIPGHSFVGGGGCGLGTRLDCICLVVAISQEAEYSFYNETLNATVKLLKQPRVPTYCKIS